MKTILVLLDSLNRNYLKAYNESTSTITPAIDDFRADCIRFNNHYIGSAPCMPARRDIFTGRYNFLERNWGGIEPFDITFPSLLNESKVLTHMITDHTHYLEIGGENYLQQFDTWECIRGQEFDHWVSRSKKPEMPQKYYGKMSMQYELNRSTFCREEDFPTPKTFNIACEWAENNKSADNFFLMVEGFDPHEPFDTPDEYLEMYEDGYDGLPYNWSGYDEVREPENATQHLKNCYRATMTMADKWFGKFINALKKNNLYDDALIILTTDHGHLLGEHGFVGKNLFHAYNDLSHLPLLVHLPQSKCAGETRDALTQNIDIMPTILNYFNIEIPCTVRGYSLAEIFENASASVRTHCIFGWHGSALNITDGRYAYFQAPNEQEPVYNYCAMPTTLWRYLKPKNENEIEMGRFLKHTKYPVYKFTQNVNVSKYVKNSLLFDNYTDYNQSQALDDKEIIAELKKEMKNQLKKHDAPDELSSRFNLEEI